MTINPGMPDPKEFAAKVARHKGWFTVLGIALIVLGTLAFVFPFATTIAAKLYLGWLFIFAGAVQLYHAFQSKGWKAAIWSVLISILYLAAGVWLAFFPLTGILTLTIFLAFLFVIQGILEAVMAVQLRPETGWGWMMFSGIIAAIAGALLLMGLPGTATWAIGIMVAINMISSGWSYLFLAMATGRELKDTNAAED